MQFPTSLDSRSSKAKEHNHLSPLLADEAERLVAVRLDRGRGRSVHRGWVERASTACWACRMAPSASRALSNGLLALGNAL